MGRSRGWDNFSGLWKFTIEQVRSFNAWFSFELSLVTHLTLTNVGFPASGELQLDLLPNLTHLALMVVQHPNLALMFENYSKPKLVSLHLFDDFLFESRDPYGLDTLAQVLQRFENLAIRFNQRGTNKGFENLMGAIDRHADTLRSLLLFNNASSAYNRKSEGVLNHAFIDTVK